MKLDNIYKEEKKSAFAKLSEIIITMASRPSGLIGLSILLFQKPLQNYFSFLPGKYYLISYYFLICKVFNLGLSINVIRSANKFILTYIDARIIANA